MTVRRILWTPGAIADVAALPPRAAARILSKIELLAEFPSLGPPMDGPYDGFRQTRAGRDRIIYEADEDEVRIAYVRHGARQLTLRLVRGDDE